MGSVRKRGSRIQQRSCPKSPPGAELSQQSGARGRALGTLCFPLFVSRGPKAMPSPCWFLGLLQVRLHGSLSQLRAKHSPGACRGTGRSTQSRTQSHEKGAREARNSQ